MCMFMWMITYCIACKSNSIKQNPDKLGQAAKQQFPRTRTSFGQATYDARPLVQGVVQQILGQGLRTRLGQGLGQGLGQDLRTSFGQASDKQFYDGFTLVQGIVRTSPRTRPSDKPSDKAFGQAFGQASDKLRTRIFFT